MFRRQRCLFALLFLGLFAAGCTHALRLQVAFDQVHGLQAQSPVLWEATTIGRVERVRYTEGGRFEVTVSIHEDFRNAVTDASRFVVTSAPHPQGTVLEMLRIHDEGAPLPNGSEVEGTTRSQVLSETMGRHLEEMLRGFRELPVEKWSREVQEEMTRLAEELGRAGRETKETLRRDVLPRLEAELEALRRWLREHDREDEVEPLERQFEELKRI